MPVASVHAPRAALTRSSDGCFLIIAGLFVGAVQFVFAAALGQKLQTPDRSAGRTALAVATSAYLMQAALFLAAGVKLAGL